MTDSSGNNPWDEKQVPIQDVVISNSWALQAILLYLEEQNPGARDRVWQIYSTMQEQAEAQRSPEEPTDSDDDPEAPSVN